MAKSSLLRGIDISLHFGQNTILEKTSFDFREGEITGIVGRNGSGKSTFLKILANQLEPDHGKIEKNPEIEILFIPQEIEFEIELTGFEFLAKSWIEAKAKYKPSELSIILDIADQNQPWRLLQPDKHELLYQKIIQSASSFGLSDLDKLWQNFSGGEKKKLTLATFILNKPDLLILDEPTNHLDIATIEKLEQNLRLLNGGVVLVSHDRYFLDKVTDKMIEIHDTKLYTHQGNYQKFLEDKAIRLEIASTQEENRQAFLKRELSWVRAGVKARGTKDKGRLQRFQNIKDQKPPLNDPNMELLLPEISPLGNKILILDKVSLDFPDSSQNHLKDNSQFKSQEKKSIVTNLDLIYAPNMRLGLIGPNGCGKSTLIKAILGQIPIQNGEIIYGKNTVFNYQDQEKASLNIEKTPLEEIGHGQETTNFGNATISTRKFLRRLLFSNQQIMTKIKHFSGGEKARVLLAKTLKEGGNFLILDEPTNDLDLETIRLLEESLLQYQGVALIVSHDRYFLNRVCTHVLSLEGGGDYILVSGGFDDLEARKRSLNQLIQNLEKAKITKPSFREIKEKQKNIRQLEKQIETVEKAIYELEIEFSSPDFYTQKSQTIDQKYQKHLGLKHKLEELIYHWEIISQEVSKLTIKTN